MSSWIPDIRGIVDAGWLVPIYPINGSDYNLLSLETQITYGINLWNTSLTLLDDCFNMFNNDELYWKCFMGETLYNWFNNDVYIYTSQTDGYILDVNGLNLDLSPPNDNQLSWLYNLMNITYESLINVKHKFSPNGYIHTAMRSDHFNCMVCCKFELILVNL